MNPTNQGYEFKWSKEVIKKEGDTGRRFFQCITKKGRILSGKKFE